MNRREQRALDELQRFTVVTPETTAIQNKAVMLSTIEGVERDFGAAMTPQLADALACAIVFYTGYHVRGDDRKAFLERAVSWYRRSGNKSALGCLLVQEPQVRNLKEAISLLEQVYRESQEFEPSLCHYAEALYKDGQYVRAYETALDVHKLALEKWRSSPASVPTAPLTTAAKALRAEARKLKKEGQSHAAVAALRRLQQIGQATAKDNSHLERLLSTTEHR